MLLRELFEDINRTGKGSTAIVGWGRGMGHKGHMMLASSVITHAKDLGGDPYFVVSRTYGPDDPLQPDEKLAIYRKVFPEQGHIFQVATDELPDLTRVLGNLNKQGYKNAVVVVGADQKAAFQYLNAYNGKPNKKGEIAFKFDNLEVISRQETNDPSRKQEGPRATPMRQVLNDLAAFRQSHPEYKNVPDDQLPFQVWRDAMSPEISDDEVRDLMAKAKTRMSQMAASKPAKKSAKAVGEDWDDIAKGALGGAALGGALAAPAEPFAVGVQWGIPTLIGTAFGAAIGAWRAKSLNKPIYQVYMNGEKISNPKSGHDAVRIIDQLAGKEHDTKTTFAIKNTKTDKIVFRKVWSTDDSETGGKPNWVGNWYGKENREVTELSTELLGKYKKAAGADASAADKAGDFKRGDKRFSGIVKATKKQFDNDAKKRTEDAAGVGIITKQNTTADVNKGTPRKNLKAFRLI